MVLALDDASFAVEQGPSELHRATRTTFRPFDRDC